MAETLCSGLPPPALPRARSPGPYGSDADSPRSSNSDRSRGCRARRAHGAGGLAALGGTFALCLGDSVEWYWGVFLHA